MQPRAISPTLPREDRSEIELHVVHLVRDPRGAQYSVLNRKAEKHGGCLKLNSAKGSPAWDALNLVTETILRVPRQCMRLRFEDFVGEPRRVLERILGMTQERVKKLPFTGTMTVELPPTHSRGGSPSRFDTGTIELRVDDIWKKKMRSSDKFVVTALTRSLLSRYGYSDCGRAVDS